MNEGEGIVEEVQPVDLAEHLVLDGRSQHCQISGVVLNPVEAFKTGVQLEPVIRATVLLVTMLSRFFFPSSLMKKPYKVVILTAKSKICDQGRNLPYLFLHRFGAPSRIDSWPYLQI